VEEKESSLRRPPAKEFPRPVSEARLAIASLAARAGDTNGALRDILAVVGSALRADSGFISLLSPDSGRLEVEARFNLPIDGSLSLAPGQGIPGWVAWHGEPLLVPDTSADSRYRAFRPGVRCQMSAPMPAGEGLVLGVVTLDKDTAGGFGPDDLGLLAELTEAAAGVMQRLWELDHLREKARQLETLVAAGQSLVSKLAPQGLFDALARDACRMMRAGACALFLNEQPGYLRLGAYAGEGTTTPQAGAFPMDSCLVAAAIHTRHAVEFADIQSPEYADLADLPRDAALHSVLATPVIFEGEVLGVLAVFLGRMHRFDNDEKRLCAVLASLGAVALQNARLYARVFQSEEALRKNERLTMLGLLSAEIAHEIRNPLTVLKLLHGGLGADFAPGDPRRTDLRVISEKLDQLEGIVTRVLNFGKAPAHLHTRCSLAEIIEDTIILIRLKLAQNNIRLQFLPPPRTLVVDGHKGQLQQVLLNLLINAMQAMPDGGAITIAVSEDKEGAAHRAVMEVTDTGSGIPEEIRQRIFDSFLSGRPDGTGLGLGIAKRVLQGHHGDITLVSTGPNGSTFRVNLPLAK
jgi:signal transduction histidine kinase